MPNIIEQQDLLKGLPDARLAMLLQNPVGDIPPFLVAAEAQRRQAIRQQFAGSENKESVVDSLTKQIANVPQNIGAKTSPTEEVPDLKGILEKNQEIQDQISSQQEKDASQSMASGGIVRRFAGGGVASLAPKGTYYGFSSGIPAQTALGSLARASSVIPQTMGVMPGNIGYQAKPAQPQQPPQPQQMRGGGMVQRYQAQGLVEPSLESLYGTTNFQDIVSGTKTFGGRAVDRLLDPLGVYDYANYFFPDYISTPSEAAGIDPITLEKERQAQIAANIGEFYGMNARDKEAALRRIAAPPVLTPEELARQREEQSRLKRQYQEYASSQQQKQPEETEDKHRARLEALYAAQQPSDWEKAQKYFAMAEQFLDPSKTTMQSIAGAGQAFAQSGAEQARAQREAELAREKGLLEYDIAKTEELRAEKLREEEAKVSALKAKTDVATSQISGLYRQSDQIADDLRRRIDTLKTQGVDESEILALPEIVQKSEMLSDIQQRIANLQLFLDTTYGMPQMPVVDTKNRKVAYPSPR